MKMKRVDIHFFIAIINDLTQREILYGFCRHRFSNEWRILCLHVDITLEVFLDEIRTSAYFTGDNGEVFLLYWHMGFCIFHIQKILIKILLQKYVTVYFILCKTGKLDLHKTWNLYFSHILISEQIFIQEIFIFYVRKSHPRYS